MTADEQLPNLEAPSVEVLASYPEIVQVGANGTPYVFNEQNASRTFELNLVASDEIGGATGDPGTLVIVPIDDDNILDNELMVIVEGVTFGEPTSLNAELFDTDSKYEAMLTYSVALDNGGLCYMERPAIVEVVDGAINVDVLIVYDDAMSEEQRGAVQARLVQTSEAEE